MMNDWSEDMLRKAVSWQAFKEGKSLQEMGAVAQAVMTDKGWRGAVSGGKRPQRVGVIVHGPTHLEVQCSCPANRSTGEICAHAVAVGLALIKKDVGGCEPEHGPKVVTEASLVRAWQISFLNGWGRAIRRGQLPVRLRVDDAATPSSADAWLNTWLVEQGVKSEGATSMQLHGRLLVDFLVGVAGHSQVLDDLTGETLELAQAIRLPVVDEPPEEGQVLLNPSGLGGGDWICIEGSYWWVHERGLAQAGQGEMPSFVKLYWRGLVEGTSVSVARHSLLADLEQWQDWLEFSESGWLRSLRFHPAEAAYRLQLDGAGSALEACLQVCYAAENWRAAVIDRIEDLPEVSGNQCRCRDWAGERSAVSRLEAAGFQPTPGRPGYWKLVGDDQVQRFMTSVLPSIQSAWAVLEGERLSRWRSTWTLAEPIIKVHGTDRDWMSFDLSFETADGEVVDLSEIRRCLRGGLVKSGTRRVVVSDQFKHVIDPLIEELDLDQRVGHYEAFGAVAEVFSEIGKKYSNPNNKNELSISDEYQSVPTFQADLRPYQKLGVTWMWDRLQRFGGALLADDMGLGKTIQTIALVERLLADERDDCGFGLVVVTATLLGNWQREWERFAPSRRLWVMHGAGRDGLRERIEAGDVVLTTYGTLARDLAWHLQRDYRVVVCDEASLMRNPDTDHAKALAKLKSGARLALTGTPVENGVQDLWSIFRFIQPGWLGGRKVFAERYADALAGDSPAGVLERLKLKVAPFVLRRTKEQVAPELPSKLIIDDFCELSNDQQSVYRDLVVEGRKRIEVLEDARQTGAARMQVLTALLRLRQCCGDLALLGVESFQSWPLARRSGKLMRLLELLQEAIPGGHRVLVFSQFQRQLLEIEKMLELHGIRSLRLDGASRNRQDLVDRFQATDGPPVFLISLKAGGYGLNLTAADMVIHFDPWWNPAADAQATDRAHRIGQVKPVTVYRLLTKGTVEEKVVALQSRKRALAAVIDDDGAGDASGWSMDELQSLLSGL